MQDSGYFAVFKITARDQGHYKVPSGAFVTYGNISCSHPNFENAGRSILLLTYLYVRLSVFASHFECLSNLLTLNADILIFQR